LLELSTAEEKMKWLKKGLIYAPLGDGGWRNQNAICPTPFLIDKNTLRIFVTMCEPNNVGRVGYVDVNPDNPSDVLGICQKPVLDIGAPGTYDDNGLGPISIVEHEGRLFLYLIGFQQGVRVPYYMFCGLAISKDHGRTFKKYSQTPILDRYKDEIYARCGVGVIKDKGKFKMWYIGSYKEGWIQGTDKLKPLYIMRYIESEDGINWPGEGRICMQFANEDEHGFGRPHVWKENGGYRMLYSIRTISRGYYVGYAESVNGVDWTRKDKEAGIELSTDGWDSLNQCYTHLFKHKGKTYMFYNGNGMGKSGFGYAELIEN
jgi:hypothetical protein